jgi:hypothetical protein
MLGCLGLKNDGEGAATGNRRIVAMSKLSAACLAILIVLLSGIHRTAECRTQISSKEDAERREAQRLWDAVLKVKGGRERLYKVNSFLATWSYDGKEPIRSRLYVYPNKYWEWVKDTPRPRGSSPESVMTLYNGDLSKWYSITNNLVLLHQDKEYQYAVDESTFFLLDTKSFHLEPIKVSRGRLGKQTVDIIETRLHDHRIDFTVEVESLVVLKISDYGNDFKTGKAIPLEYVYKDYVEIEGIKMPQSEGWLEFGKVNGKVETWLHYTYRFNVDYDPRFFDRVPVILPSLDAWRPGGAKAANQQVFEYNDWLERQGFRRISNL